MPLTLYHGPAGAQKTRVLLQKKLVPRLNLQGPQDFFLILPSRQLIPHYSAQLLQTARVDGLFFGESLGTGCLGTECLGTECLGTFEDFCWQILKHFLPKVHQASRLLGLQMLRQLLTTRDYPTLNQLAPYTASIHQLYQRITKIKNNGITPETLAQEMAPFGSKLATDFVKLFADYQNLLRQYEYMDAGDAFTHLLQALRKNEWDLRTLFATLIVDRVFPLGPAQRECLRLMKQNFPDWPITLSYSFDYQTPEDSFFYPAFTELGELADRTEHFQYTNTSLEITNRIYAEPLIEAKAIAQSIAKLRSQGVSLGSIGVIVPGNDVALGIGRQCRRLDIPLARPPLETLTAYSDRIIPLPWTNPNLLDDVALSLQSLKANDDFQAEWEFGASLFCPPFLRGVRGDKKADSAEIVAQWAIAERAATSFSLLPRNELFVGGVEAAQGFDWDYLFVATAIDGCYPQIHRADPLAYEAFADELYFREIFETPAYQWSRQTQEWQALLGRTRYQVNVSRPRLLMNGRETLPSRLCRDFPETPVQTEVQTHAPISAHEVKQPAFSELPLKQFSITQLQAYQRCPYQYYARHHLKLGDKAVDEWELTPAVRGLFTHKVLEQVLKQHLELFREATEYDLYKKRFLVAIGGIIQTEQSQNPDLAKLPSSIKQDFVHRLGRVIQAYFLREIDLFRTNKKKTFPGFLEWSFGPKANPAFKLKQGNKSFSITGRIDRIDIDTATKTLFIIDYKTGELDTLTSIKEGLSLQIPLYACALREGPLQDYQVGGGALVSLKDLEKRAGLFVKNVSTDEPYTKAMSITADQWEACLNAAQIEAGAIIAKIQCGDFAPKPAEASLCQFCDYRRICHYGDARLRDK